MYTEIKRLGGVPTLFVNGEPVYANAYVSYLDDRARYEDFAAAGIRIYSVPVYLAGRGINTDSNIGPFRTGLWDCEKELNFSPLEDDLRQVLAANPEALIFPRIDLDMPEWWDEKCPNELNQLANGVKLRQSFVSERWREDAGVALTKIICYLEQSEYRRHIIGYQIAAGGTEEWAYHGWPNADFSSRALEAFRAWRPERHGERTAQTDEELIAALTLPDDDEQSALLSPAEEVLLIDYRLFLGEVVADAKASSTVIRWRSPIRARAITICGACCASRPSISSAARTAILESGGPVSIGRLCPSPNLSLCMVKCYGWNAIRARSSRVRCARPGPRSARRGNTREAYGKGLRRSKPLSICCLRISGNA